MRNTVLLTIINLYLQQKSIKESDACKLTNITEGKLSDCGNVHWNCDNISREREIKIFEKASHYLLKALSEGRQLVQSWKLLLTYPYAPFYTSDLLMSATKGRIFHCGSEITIPLNVCSKHQCLFTVLRFQRDWGIYMLKLMKLYVFPRNKLVRYIYFFRHPNISGSIWRISLLDDDSSLMGS